MHRPATASKSTDDLWSAVVARDTAAIGLFVYAVRTTGVYCRPGCSSRLPDRRNVEFFETSKDAERAGYRACRRCRPNQAPTLNPAADPLVRACRFIERSEKPPTLSAVARHVRLSAEHLHRLFRKSLGVTPKQYASSHRTIRLQANLRNGSPVSSAIYQSGYESGGRCYSESAKVLGMTPRQFRDKGRGATIRYGLAGCSLGRLLVAVTEKGVCRIALGDGDSQLRRDLLATFPAAERVDSDPAFAKLLVKVVSFIDAPTSVCPFPLDIQGTAFQRKVWQALQKIRPGRTTSYTSVARSIGRPTAVRAVASAIAANPIAVAVPCHRVLHADGTLSGYRWGRARKKTLLEQEAKANRTKA